VIPERWHIGEEAVQLVRLVARLASTAVILALVGATTIAAPRGAAKPAEPDSLLPLATLLAPATNQAPQLSPDGRWVSFLRPVDGALNLFVTPADSPNAARPLTRRAGRGLQAFDVSGVPLARWTPDSRRILFPVDRDGDEKWNLHVVDVASGDERTLTDMPGIAVDFQRFSDDDPNAAAIVVRERPGALDLYRLNLDTG